MSILPSQSATEYHCLGQELFNQGHLDAAQFHFQEAIRLQPDDAHAYGNLGNVLQVQKKWEDALACYQKVLQLWPDCASVYGNMGNIYFAQDKFEEAMTCYQQVLRIQPEDAQTFRQMGHLSLAQNNLEAALQHCRQALHLQPNNAEIHFSSAMILLKSGFLREGWQAHEWRMGTRDIIIELPRPRWDGTPLLGRRLLVHWEQGFGDTLQFIRYLSLIKGGTVILVCQPALVTLLDKVAGVHKLIVVNEAQELSQVAFDVWTPLLSLPNLFATTLETIPAHVPYLYPDWKKVEKWRSRFSYQQLNVGIVWAGSPGHENDGKRSCSLTHFAPLAKLSSLALFSLQKGDAAGQLVPEGLHLTSLTQELTDFSETAAVIACLDLVISVDTAVAHLAGAMGKPVWVLLPFASDWRWLMNREDSPWYPTMRLFRQQRLGDWEEVFVRVVKEIIMNNENDSNGTRGFSRNAIQLRNFSLM